MSWEEMYTRSTNCPCGKGKISQTTYGDDWNRYEDGSVVIECEKCNNEFKVEEVTHSRLLASDGSCSEYFLIPKDYPDYNEPNESKTYGVQANPFWNFTGWLIENYTEDELKLVKKQLQQVKASTSLTGNASSICYIHKKAKKTVKVNAILESVEKALCEYSSYSGNKTQREKIRIEEENARTVYLEGKKKKRIPINLE